MRRLLVPVLALVLFASSCGFINQDEEAAASTSEFLDAAPASLEPIADEEIGPEGGQVDVEAVHVSVPPGATASSLSVTISEPFDGGAVLLSGPLVRIEHAAPLNEPIVVEWDIEELTEQQRRSLISLKWDESAGLWAVDDTPLEIVGDTLRITTTEWSWRSWLANISQEAQELVGRRADPPECGDLPDWVRRFDSPQTETSAVAILACGEKDPDDSEVMTMRIINNRTVGQFVHIREGDPYAWVWSGEPAIDTTGLAYYAVATSINTNPTRVYVPPLHEMTVGIARPTGGGVRLVEFESEIGMSTLVVDMVAFAAGQLNLGEAFESPTTRVFFELLVECGIAQVVIERGGALERAQAVASALTGCVKQITDPSTLLGDKYDLLAHDALVASSSTPGLSGKVSNFHWGIQQFARVLTLLDIGAFVASVGEAAVETGLVGSTQWRAELMTTPPVLGEWNPRCDDVRLDREAWSRNWVWDPALKSVGELHEASELESILIQASRPLAGCSYEHVEAVRNDAALTTLGDDKSTSIAIDVFDQLLATMTKTSATITSNPASEEPTSTPDEILRGIPLIERVVTGLLLNYDVSAFTTDSRPAEAIAEAGLNNGFFTETLTVTIIGECWLGDISMTCDVEVSDTDGQSALMDVTVYDEDMFPGEVLPGGSAKTGAAPSVGYLEEVRSNLVRASITTIEGDYYAFISPSGNIACEMTPTSAACELKEHEWVVPPPPANCDLDWGDRVSVIGDQTGMVCAGDTLFVNSVVLEYGQTILLGGTSCTSETSGVTCLIHPPGSGFTVARAAFVLY